MRFVISIDDPVIILDLGFVLEFPDSGLPFSEQFLEGGCGGHAVEGVGGRRCNYAHIYSVCMTMQYFALDLFTLCTNHVATFPRSAHKRAMCPNYASYRAKTNPIAGFCIYHKDIFYCIINIILHLPYLVMQRFARLYITMHNYVRECTDSTPHPTRAKYFGSFSQCHL